MHLSKPLEEWTQEQLIAEIRFHGGIVEEGEGRKLAEGEPISEALLAYVRRLEAKQPLTLAQLGDAITEFAKRDLEEAIQLITGISVGLLEVYVELNGEDPSKKITIKGEAGQRGITLHPRK